MATYKAQVLDGFDWWRDELRAARASLARKPKQPKPSDCAITIADDGIRAHAAGGPEFQSPPLPLDATSDEIAALLRSALRHPSVAVRIDSALLLKRRLGARRLPVRQARDMAELDLMASTPIDPSQVHIVFADGADGGSSYLVVKTKTLAPALKAIRAVGGNLASLTIADSEQILRPDPLSLAAIWPARGRERFARRAWTAAVAIVLIGLAATYGHAQWRNWQAGSVLDDEIATAQVEARKARASLQKRQADLEQTEKLRAEKKNAVPVVRILAELTRLLPDSAWVSDLSSKGDQLTITGFASSAADLIQPIDASPLFSAPEFSSPATRVPGQTGERFTITAKVEEP
ncbi:fimbrial assembly protein [Mesorhizobium sp. M2D.F.Ca.ET.223.01.1.1]|uniref:PilN domain-containing protein n=1 Tax=Mesorhizobium sp. M2D.F.Ca.ET.223.01.1.1 TaxID=2563940 RepID=UPI0010931CA3|nr:PilN domain-containing protein [Mesorhizobium sp. M2D.F.Ca.ET.223.01.1.1]TGR84231.1 fimbrial assembly protein [Mesorhizobium sp. M2D.F.Ca.ET.223.01.1.1]TGT64431.1 fimbrial assembly protein [bacterium M00.F.Ca.ET.159.01.1.1]TGT79265.1 fimbrial assembly protein [bacterium M00.F.Ca.ET.157.01.1.1]